MYQLDFLYYTIFLGNIESKDLSSRFNKCLEAFIHRCPQNVSENDLTNISVCIILSVAWLTKTLTNIWRDDDCVPLLSCCSNIAMEKLLFFFTSFRYYQSPFGFSTFFYRIVYIAGTIVKINQSTLTCSKLTIETEQGVKYVQS